MKIYSILSITGSIIRLINSLLVLWLTLRWKVRTARRAFERELIEQGMAAKDARRLSANYSKMKNQIMSVFKGSLRKNRARISF